MSETGSKSSSNLSVNSKPVPREQAFLETFFCAVGQFSFDRAHDFGEKEKEQFKPSPGSVWSSFLSALLNLSNAEKIYFTLSFVEKKLLRREHIRPLYNTLHSDFQKIEELSTKVDLEGQFDDIEILAIELSKHLTQFILARKDMIDFYVFMSKSGWSNQETLNALVNYLEDVQKKHFNCFHHPILDPVKASFTLEVEIAHHIFECQLLMGQWKFLPTLLVLYDCQGKLNHWNLMHILHKDSVTSSLSAISHLSISKKHEVPFLYKWLIQFHQALVAKFTLYFHTTLITQTNLTEMKALTAKSSVDHFARFSTFLRKSDAYNVSLILDTASLDNVFVGHGYHLPNITRRSTQGLKSYPAIVSLPEHQPMGHWPDVVSLIKDREQELGSTERLVYLYDEARKVTYYLTRVDTRMTLLAIFNTKKKEKDSYVQNFFSETRALLIQDQLYQMLKPGQGQMFRHYYESK